MASFELSKWYMDVVSDAGDVLVAYFAELRWGRAYVPYASLLVRPAAGPPSTRSSYRRSPAPLLAGDTLSWASPALGFDGRWTSLAPRVDVTVFESPEGRVEWRCHQPRATVEVAFDARTFHGRGYAEHVILSIEPWRLPIRELRWGRFVGARSGLVWIDWRGARDERHVLHDGADVGPAEVDERAVTSVRGGVRLNIDSGDVLRRGSIGKTALSGLPGVDRFPLRVLALDETKWCARGTLADGQGEDRGWVIHEVVRWPAARDGEARAGRGHFAGKVLYGTFFAVVLPWLLVAWARATRDVVRAPAWHDVRAGLALSALGAVLMGAGWAALWLDGGGLPMNAYPPPRFVTRGVYAVVSHPIYVGFTLLCVGVSVAVGSSSGLWLVSPSIALGAIALWAGYERHDLAARFPGARSSPWLGLPAAEDSAPSLSQRLAAAVMGLGPSWIASGLDAHGSDFGLLALAVSAPALLRSRRELRAFVVRGLIAGVFLLPVPLLFASVVPSWRAAFAVLSAAAWARHEPRFRFVAWGLGLAVCAAQVAAGGPIATGALASLGACVFAVHAGAVWQTLRRATEWVANSWGEMRVGPVRVINHGLWAALGTIGGVALIGALVGQRHLPAVVAAAFAGLVGSALWGQWLEGSSGLSRPYGFYGGLFGIIAAALAGRFFGAPVWLLLGAYAAAGPYVQAMGRLRCLVQGCCHGRATSPELGIRYRHPRSRVCKLAHLAGVPIHATPLYSIIWNAVTAVVVWRLWSVHAALHLIAGVYLIVSGLGRFVEESYRGEPQTPIISGLRIYQWLALGTAVAGAIITALGSSEAAPSPSPNTASLAAGVLFGLVTWAALGVDFPESNKRFSRLA